jgi:rRNA small subunit pseudouridine methyltransferase Nep1
LNKAGRLRSLAHTVNGDLLDTSRELRLPRDCYRFKSLMEQLFVMGRVPPGSEPPLITLSKKSLGEVRREIAPSRTIALTSHGKAVKLVDLCRELTVEVNLIFLGLPSRGDEGGDLSRGGRGCEHPPGGLEAWVVTSASYTSTRRHRG